MNNVPILDYRERVYFLEIRNAIINNINTLEIIHWERDNFEYHTVGYWELNEVYEYRAITNRFLMTDSIVFAKFMYKGQRMLDCYLGEIRRLECL